MEMPAKNPVRNFVTKHNLTATQFAQLVHCNGRAANHWIDGDRRAPAAVARMLEMFELLPGPWQVFFIQEARLNAPTASGKRAGNGMSL